MGSPLKKPEGISWNAASIELPEIPMLPPGPDAMSATISAVLPTLAAQLTANVATLAAKEHTYSGKLGAAQAAYRNAASQPSLPMVAPSSFIDISAQWYITKAGATPKDVMSDKESYCSPNAEVVFVKRATRPSIPSSTRAQKIAMADISKRPFIACTTA